MLFFILLNMLQRLPIKLDTIAENVTMCLGMIL
jgi:hypothetical protein